MPWPAACTYSQSTCQVEGNLLIVVVTGNGFIVFPFHVWWRLKTIEIKETTEIECHFIIGSQNSYICLSGEDVLVFRFNFVLYPKTLQVWSEILFPSYFVEFNILSKFGDIYEWVYFKIILGNSEGDWPPLLKFCILMNNHGNSVYAGPGPALQLRQHRTVRLKIQNLSNKIMLLQNKSNLEKPLPHLPLLQTVLSHA